jgi:hypothetical protein
MVGFAMSRNGSILGDRIGCRGALVSSSWICGKPGAILNTRITIGWQGRQSDTVPRTSREVRP